MEPRRVLDRDQMRRAPGKTQRTDRRGGVGEETVLEIGVRPRLGDNARPDMGTDLGLVGVNDEIKRLRVYIALLGQDGFERAHAQLHLAELRAVIAFVMGFVMGFVLM